MKTLRNFSHTKFSQEGSSTSLVSTCVTISQRKYSCRNSRTKSSLKSRNSSSFSINPESTKSVSTCRFSRINSRSSTTESSSSKACSKRANTRKSKTTSPARPSSPLTPNKVNLYKNRLFLFIPLIYTD